MPSKCDECSKRPSFGFVGEKPHRCADHKSAGMIDVVNKRCDQCSKHPAFGFLGEKAHRCVDHIEAGMIDVISKHCDQCSKYPSFGFIGEKAHKCNDHKEAGMVNVKNKRCDLCSKHPSFGFIGEKPHRCNDHKVDNMVNVTNKQCDLCSKQPSFGFIGEKAHRCANHKEANMIDVKNKPCDQCSKHPSFGFIGEKAHRCDDHKENGMVNVTSKRCDLCFKRSKFGYLGYSPSRCSEHKLSGMIFQPIKWCSQESCCNKAHYASSNLFYCDIHRPTTAHEFVDLCRICFNKVSRDLELCATCDYALKNGAPYHAHTKELEIKALLDSSIKTPYTYDRVIPNGCTMRRPDFRFDCSYNSVILEIDENQHRDYNCACETTRMKQIYFANGMSSLTFIRYNPDAYKPLAGEARLSKFKKHELLKHVLERELSYSEVPFYGIKVVYLFYDGFTQMDIDASCDFINPYQ